jgi:hypothetical protein
LAEARALIDRLQSIVRRKAMTDLDLCCVTLNPAL